MTSIDFPGQLAAVLYCQGCPWRCTYCHNPELQARRQDKGLPWRQVVDFLQRRKGLLDAVVFSGGEPTLQSGLVNAIEKVKALGFQVGLHTAGPYPQRLGRVMPWLDWVAMDIKAPLESYQEITGVSVKENRIRESIAHILHSGVAHEFRTTVDLHFLSEEQILSLASTLKNLGVRHYVLQQCRHGMNRQPTQPFSKDLIARLKDLFEVFKLRT